MRTNNDDLIKRYEEVTRRNDELIDRIRSQENKFQHMDKQTQIDGAVKQALEFQRIAHAIEGVKRTLKYQTGILFVVVAKLISEGILSLKELVPW